MAKKKAPKPTSNDLRQKITEKLVETISKGVMPWRQPWSAASVGLPHNFHSRRRYTGVNPLILMLSAFVEDYSSSAWGSFKAWQKHTGGHVRKGEHATEIVLFTMIPKRDPVTKKVETNSVGDVKKFLMMRTFSVFNASQVSAPAVEAMLTWKRDSLVAKAKEMKLAFKPKATVAQLAQAIHDEAERRVSSYSIGKAQNSEPDFEPAERLIAESGVKVVHDGSEAVYNYARDRVKMPPKKSFETMSDYYETTFHELIHSTGHKARLDRSSKLKDNYSGKERYAFEELVAEIGACYLCMELNIPQAEQMIAKSASYIAIWLKAMESNPRFIFDAATHASEAVDFLLGKIGLANDQITLSDDEGTAERAA